MQDTIKTAILKKYLDDELSNSEKRRLEKYMMEHPHYFKILKGLSQLKREYGDDDVRITQYLKEQLNNQAFQLFKKK